MLNEDELVAGIRKWLEDNKRPEELLVFDSGDWPDLDKLIHYFNQGEHRAFAFAFRFCFLV